MKYLISTLITLFSLITFAQNNYRVLKVVGCIKPLQSTDCLLKDNNLNGDETLSFDTIGSYAVLMNQSGEIISLEPGDTAGFCNGKELRYTFAESVKSIKSSKQESTSRGEAGQQVVHFNYFFGTSRFTVIGDEARFGVNPLIYPVTKDKFLVVHYKLDNDRVSKRLGFREQVVRLQKNSLTEFNGKIYDKEKIDDISIYYYEPATKKSELLVTFDLIFINPNKLYTEFEDVYKQLPNKETLTNDEIGCTLTSYFENTYGKTEPQSLDFAIGEFISKLSKN